MERTIPSAAPTKAAIQPFLGRPPVQIPLLPGVSGRMQGDLKATPLVTHGLFLNDTRFLSRWVLTVNGLRPKLLSVDDLAFDSVQFFAALATGTIYVDSHLSVVRRRAVNNGFHEELALMN